MSSQPFCISEIKRKQGVYCCAYGCTNPPVKKKSGLCHKHYWRKRKQADPVYDRYNNAKSKARQRGLEWTISFEDFKRICQRTGYIIEKGKRGYNMTIDRLDNSRDYHIDNIDFCTIRENIRRYHAQKSLEDLCPF